MRLETAAKSIAQKIVAEPCAYAGCTASHWQRWRQRNDGLEFNGQWYCGAKCLENALVTLLSTAAGFRSREPERVHRLPLGLLMVSRGAIESAELAEALQRKRVMPDKRIGECLADLGYATEAQVTRALAIQNCLPVLLAKHAEVDLSVPLTLQEEFHALCFRSTESNGMVIGFGLRKHIQLVTALEFMLGRKVEPCLISSRLVSSALEDARSRTAIPQPAFNQPQTFSEIARTVVSYCSQVHARQLRLTTVSDLVWARVGGRPNAIDLVFRTVQS